MTRKRLDDLTVVLLQARDEEHILVQEQGCFLERCRIDAHQLESVNVTTATLGPHRVDHADAVFIGGAGGYSAAGDYPWMEDLLQLVRYMCDAGQPLFGSCWGHQIIARALGGTVGLDRERAELGTGTIRLTVSGMTDPLFGRLPTSFQVNMGHHDRVFTLPAEAIELAYNDSQRNQAFRINSKPVYGTQFHSELDARRERERLIEYREHYKEDIPSEADFEEVLQSISETTDADDLLWHFLKDVVLNGRTV